MSTQTVAPCTGAGAVTVTVGDITGGGNAALYAPSYTVSNSMSATNYQDTVESAMSLRATSAASTIHLTVTAGPGYTVNNIAAGCSFNIWVDQKVLP